MIMNFANLGHVCVGVGTSNAPIRQQATPKRFEDLLPPRDWAQLPLEIKARFAGHVAVGQSRLYSGSVVSTHLSVLGKLLAHLLIPFGAPLPLHETTGGEAAIVAVTADQAAQGEVAQVWSRHYSRAIGFPQTIYSTKRFAGPTGLEERLGPGLGQCIGITLRLQGEENALHFISAGYFLWLFGTRIWLPKWLEPGEMVVSHEKVSTTDFIFRLKLTHPRFGLLVEQACLFHDMQEA
jgi:Domain of unknown function (DUF4166)